MQPHLLAKLKYLMIFLSKYKNKSNLLYFRNWKKIKDHRK